MSIIEHLATTQGTKSEAPNQALAKAIVNNSDRTAVLELLDHLQHHHDKNIQSDCIKVLYEIGAAEPGLIADHYKVFVGLLEHKNNRLVWGAMTALDAITRVDAQTIYTVLPNILQAMDTGSVITKDHGMGILIQLAQEPAYADDAFALLLEQLEKCPFKQVPMYAERAMAALTVKNKAAFMAVLTKRTPNLEKESQRKRVAKVLKKVLAIK